MSIQPLSLVPMSAPSTIVVEVAMLSPGRSLRDRTLDPDHVERLASTGGDWPPLLVRRGDLVVVDGLHRLAAAVGLGLRTTSAVMFDGSSEEALVEAIRANIAHGLPLTLKERKKAALQLLSIRGEWSDRMVARICGVSGSTIGLLRASAESGRATAEIVRLNRRVGRDGRARPTDRAALRRQIADALGDDPGASLRAIAARTGASPATVRAVRLGLGRPAVEAAEPALVGDPGKEWPNKDWPNKDWVADSACSSAEAALEFALWFDRTRIDAQECWTHAPNVPLSRVYEVLDESRRRAKLWSEFAAALQTRPAGAGRLL
jgi:ParB-like chromosome segregation protein Spo0J